MYARGLAQGRRRKPKPGTANLHRIVRVPTRSGSDGPVTYAGRGGLPNGLNDHGEESRPRPPTYRPSTLLKTEEEALMARAFHAAAAEFQEMFPDSEIGEIPYSDTGETEVDVAYLENRLRVSETLNLAPVQFKCGVKGWGGWISIENKTGLNMTFKVLTSTSFYVKPEVSWILPRGTFKVEVRSKEPFTTFASKAMTIYAAPVYFRDQLSQDKLEILWKALGTDLFPVLAAEEHRIRLIRASEVDLGDYSMMERIGMGQLVPTQTGVPFSYVSKSRFKEIWDVDEEGFGIKLKCKVREVTRMVRRVHAKAAAGAVRSSELQAYGASVVLAGLIGLGFYQGMFGPPYTVGLFGVDGRLFGYVPPPPVPKTWMDTVLDTLERALHGVPMAIQATLSSWFSW